MHEWDLSHTTSRQTPKADRLYKIRKRQSFKDGGRETLNALRQQKKKNVLEKCSVFIRKTINRNKVEPVTLESYFIAGIHLMGRPHRMLQIRFESRMLQLSIMTSVCLDASNFLN